MRTKIIVNPMANKGNCGRRWPRVRAELTNALGTLSDADIAMTAAPNHATALAREAVGAGYRRLVSVGGDGTLSETLNGVIENDAPIAPGLVLAQIPSGTSNELSRVFHRGDLGSACHALASGSVRRMDIFRVEATGTSGASVIRYGFLLALLGAPATISYRAAAVPFLKRLGPVAYVIMTAATALSYRPLRTRVSLDGGPFEERAVWGLLLCSFEGAGEGLILAPGADPGDGRLDVIELGDLGRIEALTQIVPKLGDGSYLAHPKALRRQATMARIESDRQTRADVDGEAIGVLPMTVRMLPAGIDVAVSSVSPAT